MITEGSAFLDRSGHVLAADASFLACLGLRPGDASAALRARAAADPALAAFLSGDGPPDVRLAADDGAAGCELTRVESQAGFLLRVRSGSGTALVVGELAAHAVALSRLAGSIAHDVKNPLNAMALQLALLGDKIATESDGLATACAGHLASLKNQIGRVNDVVRRFADVSDPPAGASVDAAGLAADATSLFAHEARRRRVALSYEAPAGAVRAEADPARVARLLLALLLRAVCSTPERGNVVVRAAATGADAVLSVEHDRGPADPELSWIAEVASRGAASMGGRLEESTQGERARAALVLPRERAP